MKNLLQRLPLRSAPTVRKGRYYESLARKFLQARGFRDFTFNVRSRFGEIDLVARDGDVLVFVEVRYRQCSSHGSPMATVDYRKQRKIIKTAQYFLQKNGLTNRMPCRFDVVGITENAGKHEFHWIKNAFQ